MKKLSVIAAGVFAVACSQSPDYEYQVNVPARIGGCALDGHQVIATLYSKIDLNGSDEQIAKVVQQSAYTVNFMDMGFESALENTDPERIRQLVKNIDSSKEQTDALSVFLQNGMVDARKAFADAIRDIAPESQVSKNFSILEINR